VREGASKVAVWCGTPGGDRLRRMLRWLVPLTGSEADLDRLVEWPDVEDWKIVRHEKHGAVLCGERFEALDDYETVEEVAETLLAVINRTASFVLQGDFQGAHRDHIVEQRQEGDHVIMFAETGIYTVSGVAAKLTWTKHAPDGSVIETPEDRERELLAENYAKLIPLLEAYPDLTDALRYMKDNLNRALRDGLQSCLDVEADRMVQGALTEDYVEAVRAFSGKRAPVFRGR